jgi:hypothetical protein
MSGSENAASAQPTQVDRSPKRLIGCFTDDLRIGQRGMRSRSVEPAQRGGRCGAAYGWTRG